MAATAGVGHPPPSGTATAAGGATAVVAAAVAGAAATTAAGPPQPWQPTQAERLRSHHLLEAWLQPYKDEIMGVYVNVLIGHKPVYAFGFYAAYALLLGYCVYSDRSILSLIVIGALLIAAVQLFLTVAKVEVGMPSEVLNIDPALYTDVNAKLLTFHDMCDRILEVRYQVHGLAYRVNAYRRASPVPLHKKYFGAVLVSCLLIYKLSGILSDRTVVFVSGLLLVSLPALHHYQVAQRLAAPFQALLQRPGGPAARRGRSAAFGHSVSSTY